MALMRTKTAALTVASMSLIACFAARQGPSPTIAQSEAPVLGWRVPKTLLDTTVSYTPTACKVIDGKPVLDLEIDVAVVGRSVPDMDIGRPNGLVTIIPGDSAKFWVDRNITYKVYPDRGGLLSSLSSHPVNQAGTIAGNFLTGAVKLVGLATGLPVPAPLTTSGAAGCGLVVKRLEEIKKIRAGIPTRSGKEAEDDGVRIRHLKDSITVTMKRTIDTAVDRPNAEGILATFVPPPDKALAHGWHVGTVDQDPNHRVTIRLDFKNAALAAPCTPQGSECHYVHQPLAEGMLFRQAAYIPVVAERYKQATGTREILGQPKVIAFGQYGVPRKVPLSVGAFRDTNWQIDFADTGEITGAIFGDKAVGVGGSSLFSGAAGAASSIQQLVGPKSDSRLDSETLRLQAENAALDAEIKNKTLKAQLEQLNSASPQP